MRMGPEMQRYDRYCNCCGGMRCGVGVQDYAAPTSGRFAVWSRPASILAENCGFACSIISSSSAVLFWTQHIYFMCMSGSEESSAR